VGGGYYCWYDCGSNEETNEANDGCVCDASSEDVNGECKPVCADGKVRDATSGDCVTP